MNQEDYQTNQQNQEEEENSGYTSDVKFEDLENKE
jgi:hypothetical protein